MGRCAAPADIPGEILVIDNGSTDHTRQVVEAANLPNLRVRYVFEGRPGQCHARNRGLAESAGELVLFTDDDVRPCSNWIDGMCRPIIEGRADAVAGGVVLPDHLRRRVNDHPGWFASTENLNPADPFMVGANLAFGRHVLDQVPHFDVELGPGALGFGDDTLFSRQIKEAGYRLLAAYDVTVEHHFDPTRLSRHYLLGMADKLGRSHAYTLYHWEHSPLRVTRWNSLRAEIGLWRRRLVRPSIWLGAKGAADWELDCVKQRAFQKQWVIESLRPRNYARHGLQKIAGVGAMAPAASPSASLAPHGKAT
jgi:glucosyl-dolichyl phosphate glucuronosyltransferase